MSNLTEHTMERVATLTVARGLDAATTYQGGTTFYSVATPASCATTIWSINRKKMQNVALHPFRWPPGSTA